MITLVLVLTLILLLVGSAFFSSSEVAFFSLNPLQIRRMKEQDKEQARRVERILAEPTQFLSTILIGNTMVNVAISFVLITLAVRIHPGHAEPIAMVISLTLLLIFGEIGPKRVAVTHPQTMAVLYAAPLERIIRLLTPLRVGLEKITDTFAHLFRPHGKGLSEEEFETVVELSREHGILDEEESDMVKGIIRLEDLRASDVMTPRVELIGIDLDDRNQDLVRLARTAGVRHLVVYQGQLDSVVGCLDVRRFLLDPDHRVVCALIPPLFVPEACPLNMLLLQFIREGRRSAVVVDEYGGTAGLVTRGDILEEITGDLDQEGASSARFEQVGENRWMVSGRVSLEDISDRLDIRFDEQGVDRISGWLTAKLERFAKPGDTVDTETFKLRVRKTRRRLPTLVEITVKEPPA